MANLTTIIGAIAAFLTTVSFLPQAMKTLKTRDTRGISLIMYATFTVGVIFWLIYGILMNLLIISIANIITASLASMVLAIKILNIIRHKEDI